MEPLGAEPFGTSPSLLPYIPGDSRLGTLLGRTWCHIDNRVPPLQVKGVLSVVQDQLPQRASAFYLGQCSRPMGSRKRKAIQQPPMNTFESSCSLSGGEEALYEELPCLFTSSPKRVALDSHSSGLSSQSELLCGEWLGHMSLDGTFETRLHSSPSRTSISSSASINSVLWIDTTVSDKAQAGQAGAIQGAPFDISQLSVQLSLMQTFQDVFLPILSFSLRHPDATASSCHVIIISALL